MEPRSAHAGRSALKYPMHFNEKKGGKKKEKPGSRSDSWSDPEMGAKSRRVKLEEKSDILFGE